MTLPASKRRSRAKAQGPLGPAEPGDHFWYRDAIIYELRVGSFQDGDGDGFGDFRGLTQRLEYLRDLGVTALWLLPFYPSPMRDDGYDIADYERVHPDCGTLDDFKDFVRAAHERGLRIITELVINHTSDQHPWFQRARRAPAGSRWRNFYVWSDTPERYQEARVIFKDFEPSNWTWDPVAKMYYWHRFFAHQPDLNFDNPEVRRAVLRFVDFWFDLGVDGLRLDAVPYLFEREGTNCENLPETHAFLKEMRRHVDARHRNRMLLAEANQWPEDAVAYFGDGDECHMAFHFPVMPRLFMALHMEDRFPVIDMLAQTPSLPEPCQWALFLRNHDELTLEMVTDEERDYMYRVYAHDTRARINLGIRRRLAPLLGNDRRRMELMNALLLALPGTPVLYYGDEIGMGDNIYLGDRNGVRTPMQWSADRNAGFSQANPQRLTLPVIIDPAYHYESVNVEAQRESPHSLFNWMRRLIALRKRYRAFSRGAIEFLTPSNSRVLAFVRRHEDQCLLLVANLSRFVQYVELDLSAYDGAVPTELFGQNPFPHIGPHPYLLTLGPHAFYWFELSAERRADAAGEPAAAAPPCIRVTGRSADLLHGSARAALEAALAIALPRQRWYGDKSARLQAVTIADLIPVGNGESLTQLAILRLQLASGVTHYAVPLRFVAGDEAARIRLEQADAVLAEVELVGATAPSHGVWIEASGDPSFAAALLETIRRRRTIPGSAGTLVASAMRGLKSLRGDPTVPLPAVRLSAEQSNTSLRFGDRLMLKLFRRLADGVNPELEVGRFLTERARFGNVAPVVGALEYAVPKREPVSIAILQGFVANEGDAWTYTLDQLAQYLERAMLRRDRPPVAPASVRALLERTDEQPPAQVGEMIGSYIETARTIGLRVGALHLAFACDRTDPAFAPEPFGKLYQRSLYQSVRGLAARALRQLRDRLSALPRDTVEDARRLLGLESQLVDTCRRLVMQSLSGQRMRCHGDLHLGQILRTGTDFVIIDFEGEPARSLGERRLKRSPLRDVAGMLRSYDYATHAALRAARERGLTRNAGQAALGHWVAFWRAWVGSSFLRAYMQQIEGAGLLPKNRAETGALLRFLMLEKSIYELGYEVDSRPDWVGIPVRGILSLLDEEGDSHHA